MRMRNEINKIGLNVNQIVKNNNSHMYKEADRVQLKTYLGEIVLLQKTIIKYMEAK